jgi:DNA-binding transcriptional ArsR family regulator
MTVLLGTLGFTPAKFLGVIKTIPDITRVVFYTAHTDQAKDRARSEKAVAEVDRALTNFGITHEHVKLSDPFDFGAFLTRFLEDIKKAGPGKKVFNLTGGTKPMAIAATLACIMLGVPAYYVPEEHELAPGIELPIFRIRYSTVLTPKAYRVLEAIHGREPDSLGDLADRLGIEQSTLSGHLRKLEECAAIRLVAVPGKGQLRRPELTEAGSLLLAAERLAGVR